MHRAGRRSSPAPTTTSTGSRRSTRISTTRCGRSRRRCRRRAGRPSLFGKWHLGHGDGHDPAGFDHWRVLPGQGHYHNPVFLDSARRDRRTWRLRHRPDHRRLHRLARSTRSDAPVRAVLPAQGTAPHVGARRASTSRCTTTSRSRIPTRSATIWRAAPRSCKRSRCGCSTSTRSSTSRRRCPTDSPSTRRSTGATSATSRTTCASSRRWTTTSAGCSTTSTSTTSPTNTIVVYTSDQGFFLGDHGWFDKRLMYEESLAMPLLIRYPDVIDPGTTSDDIVVNVDFGPTLLDLCGVDVPDHVQGRSFAPLLRGETPDDWPDVDVLPLLDAQRRRPRMPRPLRRADEDAQVDLLLQRPARPTRRSWARRTRSSGSCSISSPTRSKSTTSTASRARRRSRPNCSTNSHACRRESAISPSPPSGVLHLVPGTRCIT